MDYVATSFSFAVNLLCTLLIFVKDWWADIATDIFLILFASLLIRSYLQNFRVRPVDAGQNHGYTDIKRILTLLIESGMIFCSIQVSM
ncbi:hypothetical protein F5050DRAFT_460888 [Lentinula boryana]|uniref:Uncharacterized protein n=1 Tax=Lentinula boryana TaxID=40481 RepID=A0ABQ8Q7U6_9AGAR|nr:hypothetical protein F5050DRAFT_460888 [Lentinula boryana]